MSKKYKPDTKIRYTKIPNKDDFFMHESECILTCYKPVVTYIRFSQELRIVAIDVDLTIKAKNIFIEELA